MDLNEEFRKRVHEIQTQGAQASKRGATIFWYFAKIRTDKEYYLPREKDALQGWEDEEVALIRWLADGDFTFTQLEDRLQGVASDVLASLATFFHLRLGIVSVTEKALSMTEKGKQIPIEMRKRLIDPGVIGAMITDEDELMALTCHGIDIMTSKRPLPFEFLLAMGKGDKQSLANFHFWKVDDLDELYEKWSKE